MSEVTDQTVTAKRNRLKSLLMEKNVKAEFCYKGFCFRVYDEHAKTVQGLVVVGIILYGIAQLAKAQS